MRTSEDEGAGARNEKDGHGHDHHDQIAAKTKAYLAGVRQSLQLLERRVERGLGPCEIGIDGEFGGSHGFSRRNIAPDRKENHRANEQGKKKEERRMDPGSGERGEETDRGNADGNENQSGAFVRKSRFRASEVPPAAGTERLPRVEKAAQGNGGAATGAGDGAHRE